MGYFALVGDVGGTNARFALVKQGSVELEHIQVFSCADYDNFSEAFNAYFALIEQPLVNRACVSFACPIADEISMTNNHWGFNVKEVQRQLQLQQFILLNDFTAMAYGTLFVDSQDKVLVQRGSSEYSEDSRLVIGPGTGLGVSGLVPVQGMAQQLSWQALTTEGGHVSFAPTNELQAQIQAILQRDYPRVSVERILSGDGILALYKALCEIKQQSVQHTSAAQVTAAAMASDMGNPCDDGNESLADSDPIAELTLNTFCEVLGATTGDMVLAQGARGGVYLCGGILPRIESFFMRSHFTREMANKGRFNDYIQQVPVWLCNAQYPGLLGAAGALKMQLTD